MKKTGKKTGNRQCMTKDEILRGIQSLAMSQGSYGRLLQAVKENDEALDELYNLGCRDMVDLVMALES